MTEHEKLKEICDEIGYGEYKDVLGGGKYFTTGNNKFNEDYNEFWKIEGSQYITQDVREIIFTQEFMNLYIMYFFGKQKSLNLSDLLDNLDNPVEYLYSLINN